MTTAVHTAETITFPTREAWLHGRHGLGSSDVPIVLGLSTYKSSYALWAEKVGASTEANEPTEWQEIGLLMEPVIAEMYQRRTGRPVVEPPPYTTYRHPTVSWLFASPDRLTHRNRDEPGVVECKNASRWKAEDWAEEPPMAAQVQLQIQLAVLGYGWGSVAGIVGGSGFRAQDFERHDVLIERMLVQLDAFWRLVQAGTPPAADGSASTREALAALYPRDDGTVIDLPAEADEWHARFLAAKESRKAAEADEATFGNLLRAAMGEASVGMLPKGGRYTLKAQTRPEHVVAESTFRVLRHAK